MPFKLNLANNTILSCFFPFLFIELAIPIGTPNKKAKAKIEIYPVILETKIRTCSMFCDFYSSIRFNLFLQGSNFLFHLYFLI